MKKDQLKRQFFRRACRWMTILPLLWLAGCGVIPERDSGPDHGVDLSKIPDAIPKVEPRSETGNPESYVENGKRYWIIPNPSGFTERGIASWYGKKFHGRRTSSGDTYDMLKMTAAHPTLPIPIYARVTNLNNKRSVIVRINDRGPFIEDRVIDLSYVAAAKLGITKTGTGWVEIEVIDPAGAAQKETANDGVVAKPLSDNKPLPVKQMSQPVASVATPAPTVDGTSVAQVDLPKNSIDMQTETGISGKAWRRPEVPEQTFALDSQEQKPLPASYDGPIYIQVGAFSDSANAQRYKADLQSKLTKSVLISPLRKDGVVLNRVHVGPFKSLQEASAYSDELQSKHNIQSFRFIGN